MSRPRYGQTIMEIAENRELTVNTQPSGEDTVWMPS